MSPIFPSDSKGLGTVSGSNKFSPILTQVAPKEHSLDVAGGVSDLDKLEFISDPSGDLVPLNSAIFLPFQGQSPGLLLYDTIFTLLN
jgi:hypothetical protein